MQMFSKYQSNILRFKVKGSMKIRFCVIYQTTYYLHFCEKKLRTKVNADKGI